MEHRGTERTRKPCAVHCFFFLVLALGWAPLSRARAQASSSDLLHLYRWERIQAIARERMNARGSWMEPLPPVHLETVSDTIRAWLARIDARYHPPPPPNPEPRFDIESLDLVAKLETPVFEDRFRNTDWAFLGANRITPLDTLKSADLRARLQSHFGVPTRTMAEVGYPDSLLREEIIQFEYWFVLNDSIPALVLDVNGPWNRGLVFAADKSRRNELELMKAALLGQLVADDSRTPYADYYYNFDRREWYVTGFDGARLVDVRIDRPNLILGRPGLDRLKDPAGNNPPDETTEEQNSDTGGQ